MLKFVAGEEIQLGEYFAIRKSDGKLARWAPRDTTRPLGIADRRIEEGDEVEVRRMHWPVINSGLIIARDWHRMIT